jgi:hypothetical protein
MSRYYLTVVDHKIVHTTEENSDRDGVIKACLEVFCSMSTAEQSNNLLALSFFKLAVGGPDYPPLDTRYLNAVSDKYMLGVRGSSPSPKRELDRFIDIVNSALEDKYFPGIKEEKVKTDKERARIKRIEEDEARQLKNILTAKKERAERDAFIVMVKSLGRGQLVERFKSDDFIKATLALDEKQRAYIFGFFAENDLLSHYYTRLQRK